ncbi:MAG TPA: NUDIX hydrolase [Allosphingosinicella sp.]|nr:NUDIX hydrolase [Allosphingosinicella sp.]
MTGDSADDEGSPADRWEVFGSERVHENPWFSVRKDGVRHANGANLEYYVVDHGSVAIGVVVRRAGRYMLIRQFRFIVDRFVWAIPSGGVEPGESLEDAARRELLEETGLKAIQLRHLLHYFPSYGCSNQRFELFLADDPEDTDGDFDPAEVIDTRWFEKDELLQLLQKNGIVDGLSLVPLLHVLTFHPPA